MTDIDKLAREIADNLPLHSVPKSNLIKAIVELANAQKEAGMKLQRERDAVIDPNVLDFLMGIAPLEGCHFGEKHPTRKGAFWWRTVLRERSEMIKQEAIRSAL